MVICSQQGTTRTLVKACWLRPMEIAQEANWKLRSLDWKTEAISDARLALSTNRATLGKTPWEGKDTSAQSHGKLGNRKEKVLKQKVGPVLQNRRNVEGILGGKWIWAENEWFHTFHNACPMDERENHLSLWANGWASQSHDKRKHRRIWGL